MRVLFLTFMMVVWLTGIFPAQGQAAPQIIRAAIAQNQHSVEVTAPEGAAFQVDGRKSVLPASPKQSRMILAAELNGFSFCSTHIGATTLIFQAPDNGTIEVNRKLYRGAVLIQHALNGASFHVINILPLEQYLCGVVPQEMPASWPKEALKAQAIAARSFALALRAENRQNSYDVPVGGQAYGGYAAEQAATNQAVNETAGVVLTYNGECIPGYYYSASGGYTESSETVWGADRPYLQAVPDVETKSPLEKWEKFFVPEELDKRLVQAGFSIGKLESIQLSVLKKPPVNESDRGVSGRVKQVRFIGAAGEINIDGNRLRQLLQLPSTFFDISIVNKTPKVIETTITDGYGIPVLEKKIPVAVGDQVVTSLLSDAQKQLRRISRGPGIEVRFSGRGFGHGVGMSQWGAKTIAEAAKPEEKDVYKNILFKYYQGVTLFKAYEE